MRRSGKFDFRIQFWQKEKKEEGTKEKKKERERENGWRPDTIRFQNFKNNFFEQVSIFS